MKLISLACYIALTTAVKINKTTAEQNYDAGKAASDAQHAANLAALDAQHAAAQTTCDAKCQTDLAVLAAHKATADATAQAAMQTTAAANQQNKDDEAVRIALMIAETERMQDEWEAQQDERMILQQIDYLMKDDANKDGALTVDEFKAVAAKQWDDNKTQAYKRQKGKQDRLAKRWSNEKKWYTPKEKETMVGFAMSFFHQQDVDGDGKINAEEIRGRIETELAMKKEMEAKWKQQNDKDLAYIAEITATNYKKKQQNDADLARIAAMTAAANKGKTAAEIAKDASGAKSVKMMQTLSVNTKTAAEIAKDASGAKSVNTKTAAEIAKDASGAKSVNM